MPRLAVVGSRAWEPLTRTAFHGLDERRKDLAGAVLRYLHDLHVGVTPELAAGLARALSTDGRHREAAGPWAEVFERLGNQLAPESGRGSPRRERRRYSGMVPGTTAFYCVARIAAPLVARASEELDLVYLFGADPDPCPDDFGQRYQGYSARLAHRLSVLVSSDELSEVFWADRAFTLSRLSRSASPSAAAPVLTSGTPDVDVVGLAELLRLEPETAGKPWLRRSLPRRLTSSPRYRPLMNRNEGGVDGIFQTRRTADLPGMLKSEFLNPRPLLLERMLSSGYLALRRPPLREKQRDVLIGGVLPPSGSPSTMRRALVKAAWFDAMARLSVWLRRAGLRRSEFLWIEPDARGRRRDNRILLADLPADLRISDELTPAFRKEFLAALGWLPDFLDLNAAGRGPSAAERPREEQGDALAWSTSAWRGLRDHPRWHDEKELLTDEPAAPLDREAFDTVHLMSFLPRKLEKTTSVGTLRHAFGVPAEAGFSVSVTWLPEVYTDTGEETGWAVSVERKPTRPLLGKEAGVDGRFENRLAGALLDVWLKTILEELVRDG